MCQACGDLIKTKDFNHKTFIDINKGGKLDMRRIHLLRHGKNDSWNMMDSIPTFSVWKKNIYEKITKTENN